MVSYRDVTESLRRSYDAAVEFRESSSVQPWKHRERERFLRLLQAEQLDKLIEVGAGTGVHSRYFLDNGINVVATDLSPAMVQACREKGIEAYERDFMNLGFEPECFDAVFAMNCLLHVPHADFEPSLRSIAAVLRPGGLFYLGQYGGLDSEGFSSDDTYDPPRFFAQFNDTTLVEIVGRVFEIDAFRIVSIGEGDRHFQSLILRKADG